MKRVPRAKADLLGERVRAAVDLPDRAAAVAVVLVAAVAGMAAVGATADVAARAAAGAIVFPMRTIASPHANRVNRAGSFFLRPIFREVALSFWGARHCE